ncbi:MAG: DivIVA domain-containing protein [Clostridiales bacterium]|nr:DivIVA domain-containing protein [Clostridiales bacterium]
MITPLDIQNKEFPKGMRGYKEEEVDRFLDLLTVDYEKLIEENHILKEKINDLTKELEAYKEQKESIQDTINMAKQLMNDISASAEKRAELLIKNAELDADRIIKEAQASTEKVFQEYEEAKNRINIFVTRYKTLLESELDRFNGINNELFDDSF